MFQFALQATDKKTNARVGTLMTPHGPIQTPCYIPVGTAAAVKGLTPQEVKALGAQIVLANTYHLLLRPGADVVASLGGLNGFMGWDGPTMTDSGGYQVFSLGSAQEPHRDNEKKLSKFTKVELSLTAPERFIEEERLKVFKKDKTQRIRPAKIDDEGVTFYSHLDGSEHRLDPERSIRLQEQLGADLIVAFDDHESPLWNYEKTKYSLERSNRWGLKSLAAQKRTDQLMYGVTHGGAYRELREQSAKFSNEHFPAVAIGGSYTSKEILYRVLEWSVPFFAREKPRHLLGIGEVQDIFEGVARGMDFFDCVAPTRRARHGSIYVSPQNGGTAANAFTVQITNTQYGVDKNPLDPGCACYTCQHFTRGYLNHLFKAKELLAYHLATYHNVYFVTHLTEEIRTAIIAGSFTALKQAWLPESG